MSRLQKARRFNEAISDIPAITMRRANMAVTFELDFNAEAERKAQLLRTYTSLLRSTPLMLIFQHNNITAKEWAALRRELRSALAAVPPPAASPDGKTPVDITPSILLQVVRTHMFSQALKVEEFFDPATIPSSQKTGAKAEYTHDLSMAAYKAVKAIDKAIPEDSMYAQVAPLMIGPLALLTFPAVSPQHLAAALSVLSPSPPAFPAPTRKKSPGYYDLTTQSGLHKLLLVGARIEGKVFDLEGAKWVGGIGGGLDGLRAQLVTMLQGAGMGLTTALEGASKSLWVTMESRRTMLEDEQKEGEKKE
ncbi:54S ribosomal protein L11, mitochondrial [Cytospora mali]|nr:54S ribosomal protein L11, mitochondrial [Valsa mali var. pyri (nom. inval.)]